MADWLTCLSVPHLLNHVYALATEHLDAEQVEAFDEQLWGDPTAVAAIRAELGLP